MEGKAARLMENSELRNSDRRRFLIAAPISAGSVLIDRALIPPAAFAQTATISGSSSFTLFSASSLADIFKSLADTSSSKIIYHDNNVSIMLTVEKSSAAKEFEWHENRDHVFHILQGSTIYELGGKPKDAHNTGPGEWLAPDSDGSKMVTLSAGDVLVVPRGTPHRRRTPESVTLILVSPGLPRS
jgi:mannose-6-phosphate isomerase-like protein (cupin superfamily)